MQVSKLISKKSNAMDIWQNRHLFQLNNFPVASLIRLFLELHPASTFNQRKKHFLNFYKTFQKRKVEELNMTTLQAWFSRIQIENNLTEKTMHKIKCQMNIFFKWLKEEGIIEVNHLNNIHFRQNIESQRQRVVLSTHELKEICDNAQIFSKDSFFPVLYTLIHTGARRSEVINLLWKDIDFENNMIVFSRTKNGQSRKIKMSLQLRQLLEKVPRLHSFIFINSKGTKVSGHSMSRAIQRFKLQYPLSKDWRMHDLRHSFAYNYLLKGGEMYQLQAILGHKSIKMTVDLYGQLKAHDIVNPSPYAF